MSPYAKFDAALRLAAEAFDDLAALAPQAAPQESEPELQASPLEAPAALVHAGVTPPPTQPVVDSAAPTIAAANDGDVSALRDVPGVGTYTTATTTATAVGTARRRYRRWTDAESVELRRLAVEHCVRDVARLMDRDESALRPWVKRLGVTFARWTRATDDDCDDGDACTTGNPCTNAECDTAPPSPETTAVHEEVCLGRPATDEPSDGAASATPAQTTPATTATPARPLPRGELARRVLAELAGAPAHRVTLFALGGSPESVTMTLARLRKKGKVEPRGRGVWGLVAQHKPVLEVAEAPPARPERSKGTRRSFTMALKRLTRGEMASGAALIDIDTFTRPRTRADCVNARRPCPFVACTQHLALDVDKVTGSIKVNFPGVVEGDFDAMTDTCALDVSDRGGLTLEGVADVLNLTRERVRQVEVEALERMRGRRGVSADDARGLGAETHA